ncbi:hypothetical protein HYZ64_01190 [Candidatus Berkelbacteria bacterium]|nr:hypothetical protein [Candidatus Berkelbacteria bacterium]
MPRVNRKSTGALIGIALGFVVVGALAAGLGRLLPSASDQAVAYERYTNRAHGIEFRYPSEWRLETDTQGFEQGDLVSVTKLNQSPVARTEIYDGARFTVGVPFAESRSAEAWARSYYASVSVDDSANLYGRRKVGGTEFTTVKTCSILGCSNYYHAKHRGKLYSFLLIAEGKSQQEHLAAMEDMLASLRLR